jgi:dolichol-phosphate mannosyltransferase
MHGEWIRENSVFQPFLPLYSPIVAADIAIIVPVFNEAENILPLAREVTGALRNESRSYELFFVDDASTDNTWGKIQEAHRLDSRVRALRHQKNHGQSAALWTGVQATTAPIIATLDGDLQNDPADLPHMLGRLDAYDFVCGVRSRRQDRWVRRISSRIARWARKRALAVDFCDTGCALRVFKRSALNGVFPFHGWHRFLPVLVHANGAKTVEVPVNHRSRIAGVSKYGIGNRLWRGMVDLLALAWFQKRRLTTVPSTALTIDAKESNTVSSPEEAQFTKVQ